MATHGREHVTTIDTPEKTTQDLCKELIAATESIFGNSNFRVTAIGYTNGDIDVKIQNMTTPIKTKPTPTSPPKLLTKEDMHKLMKLRLDLERLEEEIETLMESI